MKGINWRLTWLSFLGVTLIALGILLAALNSTPSAFLANAGFMLTATALGVTAAILIVQKIINERIERMNRDMKLKVLRSVGRDSLAAIRRIFGPSGLSACSIQNLDLNTIWPDGIETGKVSPNGFKDSVYSYYQEVIKDIPLAGTVLTDSGWDFEVGMWMIQRALGRVYGRFDLFDVDELPTDDLVSAAGILSRGKSKGNLNHFEAASLLSPLCEAVESCGNLLWEIEKF